MRLSLLKAQWLEVDQRRVALVFLCPICVKNADSKPDVLSCWIVPQGTVFPRMEDDLEFFDLVLPRMFGEGYGRSNFVGCKRDIAWRVHEEIYDIERLTLLPSLNHHHWHGFITNGACTGGGL